MDMAEHEIVDIAVFFKNLFAVTGKPFDPSEVRGFQSPLLVICPAFVREIISQPAADIGMQPSEEPLVDAVPEDLSDELVAFVSLAESVAMGKEKPASFNVLDNMIGIDGHIQLLFEVAECPDIVVAAEEVYGDAAVGDGGQFPE